MIRKILLALLACAQLAQPSLMLAYAPIPTTPTAIKKRVQALMLEVDAKSVEYEELRDQLAASKTAQERKGIQIRLKKLDDYFQQTNKELKELHKALGIKPKKPSSWKTALKWTAALSFLGACAYGCYAYFAQPTSIAPAPKAPNVPAPTPMASKKEDDLPQELTEPRLPGEPNYDLPEAQLTAEEFFQKEEMTVKLNNPVVKNPKNKIPLRQRKLPPQPMPQQEQKQQNQTAMYAMFSDHLMG